MAGIAAQALAVAGAAGSRLVIPALLVGMTLALQTLLFLHRDSKYQQG